MSRPAAGGRSIFGDPALYENLCEAAAVLAQFVACAPRPLDLARLVQQTGAREGDLRAVCAKLCATGVLEKAGDDPPRWILVGERNAITLEDAFRCALAMHAAIPVRPGGLGSGGSGVDMLVMQAAIAVDQSVMKLLRQFPLDRLAFTAQRGRPPVPARLMHGWAAA